MADDRLRAVREAFGEPLPDGIDTLTAAELDDLAAALAEAHAEQAVALDAAIDRTLRHLPWPLSGLVRRVLIG
ncbi:MAG: hypothetical protein QOI73_351 [Solirubrobacteraceae bacterium]|jgi:hypothetical protein|nr:hypothetical protein [Solirubrobacteraceae bacterium]